MAYKEFFDTPTKKADAFDRIAKLYYEHNFGNCSKAETDALLFHIYIQARQSAMSENGTNVFSQNSDYKIGRELGLTPTKVKNLKMKAYLMYAEEENEDWKKTLLALLQDEKNYYIENDKVYIHIPDMYLFYAVEDFINETVGFVDYLPNSKIFSLRLPYFMNFLRLIADEKDRKEFENALEKYLEKEKPDIAPVESTLDKFVKITEGGKNIADIVKTFAELLTPGGAIAQVLSCLGKKIQKRNLRKVVIENEE